MKNGFRKWDASHLFHDFPIGSFVNVTFLERQCIAQPKKDVDIHVSQIILHMLPPITKPSSSPYTETKPIYACDKLSIVHHCFNAT